MAETRPSDTSGVKSRRYDAMLEAADEAIIIFQPGRVVDCNRRALELFGVSREEFFRRTPSFFSPLLQPDGRDSAGLARQYVDLTLAGQDQRFFWQHRRPDGHLFHCEVSLSRIEGEEGQTLMVIVRDDTARWQAEEELRQREELYRLLAENSQDMITLHEPDGTMRYVSPACRQILGYEPEELVGRRTVEFYHPDELDLYRENRANIEREGCYKTPYYRYRAKSGGYVWFETICRVMPGPEGRGLREIQCSSRDVTVRKAAEDSLRQSEERLKEAQRLGRIGHWEYDVASEQMTLSEAVYDLLERPRGQGTTTLERALSVYFADAAELLTAMRDKAIERGETLEFDTPVKLPGSRKAYHFIRVEPVRDAAGRVVRLKGTTQDVTSRRQAEEHLRQLVEEKDLRLREIHHRVKNNLQIISSLLTLQAGELADPAAVEGFRESRLRIQSMALVHEQLFAGGDLSRLDLAGYVERIVRHLFETYVPDQGRIGLELDLSPASLPIDKAIPCGLIVNELTTNALKHAFPPGRKGTLGVRLAAEDGRVLLEVSDDGAGLPPGNEPGAGQSLGLKLVASLTRQLGGELDIERGARLTFRVTIPVA